MTGWRQYNRAKVYRVHEDGRIEVRGSGIPTTSGEPLTARAFLLEYGDAAREASERFCIPVPWIVGMASIEALRLSSKPNGMEWTDSKMPGYLDKCLPDRGWKYMLQQGYDARGSRNKYRMDPVSLRKEPGYVSPEDTPGRVSAGLMQTLLSTARDMESRYGILGRVPHLGDLIDARTSILYGTAYMAHLVKVNSGAIQRLTEDGQQGYGADFVLMTGAYNAGSIKPASTPFGLLTYSDSRTQRAIEMHNDTLRA